MGEIEKLTAEIRAFAQAREWEQFHTPKNLAMALAVEASELMEPFQWLTAEEAEELAADSEAREAVASEIADVAIFLLRLADVMGVDVETAVREKLEVNEGRFPVEEVRGRARMPEG